MNHSKTISNDKNIGSLAKEPPQSLTILFNQINSLFDETDFQDGKDFKLDNCNIMI